MGVDLHPFRAYRPQRELAATIASPPYDVLNSAEAREMARGNELSFLHVNKPEIDLDPGLDPYDDQVYARGKQNLDALLAKAYLQDPSPCFYVYQQKMGEHVQAGLVAGASVDDYQADRIKKHELTRAEKERDRVRHVETLRAHTGPVFLTYRAQPTIDALIEELKLGEGAKVRSVTLIDDRLTNVEGELDTRGWRGTGFHRVRFSGGTATVTGLAEARYRVELDGALVVKPDELHLTRATPQPVTLEVTKVKEE